MSEDYILDIRNITKAFPGTLALDDVSVKIKRGEIHAICGENGAGKSTLMNILAGNYQQDAGEILLDNKMVENPNQITMRNLGIGIVYQERSLIPTLNVAENIFADRFDRTRLGLLDYKSTHKKAGELLELLKVRVATTTQVSRLSPAVQQMVEIAKALSLNSRVLLLDEPTATITESETVVLFDIIKDLKNKGITIVYISHRIAEVMQIADRVTILKDGKLICTDEIQDTDIDRIVRNMVGRNVGKIGISDSRTNEMMIDVRNLRSRRFRDVSFQVRKGEILTITGLAGAGRTELAMALFGADPHAQGEVYLDGVEANTTNVGAAMRSGIGYMPEDRKEQGLFLEMSITDNIISGNLDAVTHRGLFHRSEAEAIAKTYKDKLNIRAPSTRKIALELSGGNQQKLVIAKWLLVNPKLLIVDEPTRGVDVGAKLEIYQLIQQFVKDGRSVLVISSEMREVLTISDRILVMAEGRITGELLPDQYDEELILKYASGIEQQGK